MQTQLQAFLYRVVTANRTVGELVAEGSLSEPSTALDQSSTGSVLDDFSLATRVAARRMGRIYELLFCFENSVRELIETTLREVLTPETWWEEAVPEAIRKKADSRRRDDERARWHGPRGTSPLNFVDFEDLAKIIIERWDDFDDLLGDREWVENYFSEMNRTRRAIGHTGDLSQHAVERMELFVREWLLVVG
ncbi:MAG TPA: Swt1 family HEPN domain-containing protein [Gaiellaceae bacterium]|nr:Swt1 family HEPN domain-containing protein [Gaiellaceae bacterium]